MKLRRRHTLTVPVEKEPIEVVIHSFARDDGRVVVFGATRTDNGNELYVLIPREEAGPLARALDYEEPVVDIQPWQLVGSGGQ